MPANQTENEPCNNIETPDNEDKKDFIVKLVDLVSHPYLLGILSKFPPIFTNLLLTPLLVLFTGSGGVFLLTNESRSELIEKITREDNQTNYIEKKIDMNDVCKTLENEVSKTINGSEELIGSKSDLSKGDELWRVFRWKCIFSIKDNSKPIFTQRKVEQGVDLHEYCKNKFHNEFHKDLYATHKQYTNEYSLYCTSVHYEHGDE